MDLRKLAISDQFSSSIRRKVVSGFGLGLVASLLVLSVLLFNVSFKAPFLNPVFQGFNTLGSHNSTSSLFSWHFSFSSSTSDYSSSAASSANASSSNIANVAESNRSKDAVISHDKDMVLENTLVANFSEKVNNGGSIGEDEGNLGVNDTDVDKNGNFSNAGVPGNGGVGLFSQNVKNGSENIEGGAVEDKSLQRNVEGLHPNETFHLNSNAANNEASVDSNFSNLTYKEDNVGSIREEEKVLGEENGHMLPKTDNSTSSDENSEIERVHKKSLAECDIFYGQWVRDDTKPYYPPGSCPHIDRDFDCHLNKRPDNEYVKWRWQPHDCDIPSLNATDFLERLRGQKLVFVGDSLNRNMWESLVCILRHSVGDKKRVYEISGRSDFKKKGFYAFRFEDYNCSVDFVSSPFLVRESSFHGKNGSSETLRLDLMDRTTSMYHDADVLIFNTGHWWTHEKTSRGEDYYQEGNHIHARLKVMEAYKRALATWGRWVDKNIDGSRTQVIFRGYSVTHFRGGRWNSGGQCHKETEPIYNGTHLTKYPSKMKVLEHVLQDVRFPVIYMNISRLTDYRKDGHPSIYRTEYKTVAAQIAGEHAQDCSHWCLPGVPDTWNELLYVSLLKSGKGSWKTKM